MAPSASTAKWVRLKCGIYCVLDSTGEQLILAVVRQLQLSARAFHRVLKLGRTIADLAGEQVITPPHLAEALQYRPRETA